MSLILPSTALITAPRDLKIVQIAFGKSLVEKFLADGVYLSRYQITPVGYACGLFNGARFWCCFDLNVKGDKYNKAVFIIRYYLCMDTYNCLYNSRKDDGRHFPLAYGLLEGRRHKEKSHMAFLVSFQSLGLTEFYAPLN